jgi:putative DNA primase/helicase
MSDDPFDQIAPEDGALPPPPEDGSPEPEREAAALPLNDTGNGARFRLYHGADAIFVPRVGWHIWDGLRWLRDDDRIAVRTRAQTVSERMQREVPHVRLADTEMEILAAEPEARATERRVTALEAPSPEDRAELVRARELLAACGEMRTRLSKRRGEHRRAAKAAGNSNSITNMLTEAGVHLARTVEALDAEPLEVNTLSGVLRFTQTRAEGMAPVAAVELVPHAREGLHTKLVPVDHDPDAGAPLFTAFLERVQPSGEMRRFLQRWLGLSMTALTGEQKLAFLYGHGANGKSVLMDLMGRMMGDYAATAKIESLTGTSRRGGGDATPDLVPLMGARMVRASEPEQGEKLREGIIKELTGGEPLLVRALHSDFVEVKPRFKLTLSGNHKPEIRGTDEGIWRRVLLVPFDVQIPPEERDPDLGEKLWAERSGILNWMIEGLLDYLEGGLQEPEAVLDATRAYRAESDPVGTFLTDATVVSGQETDFIASRELIEAFNFWLEDRGETRWGGRTVSLRLKDKAGRWRHPASGLTFAAGKNVVTGYRGIRFADTFARRMAESGGERRSSLAADDYGGDF